MRKRAISILLILCIVLSLLPMQALAAEATDQASDSFSDVKQGDWYYDAVQYVKANGIFNGTGEGTFTPNGSMTRGMFVTVLGRMVGVDASAYRGKGSSFSDVSSDAYYAPFVSWAVEYGITFGTGNGKFSPNATISREQMAVLFVRYFEAFDICCDTGADITSVPADLDEVAPYARDAVIKLWKMGIMNGDGVSFNPKGNATRAQAASICMVTDEAVETWYPEPGIPSEREKVKLPKENTEPDEDKKAPGTYWQGGSSTQYYKVHFAKGDGQADIALPATATYVEGTPVSSLPTPSQAGMIFLGWYYDANLTNRVETDDTIQRNMTLYAKVAAGEDVSALETPNYVTVVDEPTSYTFQLFGEGLSEERIREDVLSFTQVTVNDVAYTINGNGQYWTITPQLKEGMTYQAELKDDSVVFVLNGEKQDSSVRFLNILTAKAEVTNASLNPRLKQIERSSTDINEAAFNGLFQVDESGISAQNNESGTFTYTGSILFGVGDTLAIKDGNVDLDDVTSNEGRVAYVKIIERDGDTYSYEMADIEDVLFLPDALPISTGAYIDNVDNQLTISAAALASVMTEVDAKELDAGDFIGIYDDTGSTGYQNEAIIEYGEITGYVVSGDNYIITYTPAEESDIENALDVYYTNNQDIELTDAEETQIMRAVRSEFQQNEYTEQAALYMAAVMLESDNLNEVPDAEGVSEQFALLQASPVTRRGNTVMRAQGANTVTLNLDPRNINVKLSKKWLDNLRGTGLEAIVEVPFSVNINKQLTLEFTATFEEEVLLNTIIKTEKLGDNIFERDYRLTTTFDIGNYTGVQFTVNVKSGDGNSESMTQELDALMDRMEQYSKTNGVQSTNGDMESLASIYSEIMESANDAWLDILNVPLFDMTGDVFYHIFCYQIKASFVVSANICASMGLSFDYKMQKQYEFTIQVGNRKTTNKTTDIIRPVYTFDFYVVGTIGIRAGLRLEMYVGLFDLGLDKIGITAEAGAYARLWGYFFYHYSSRYSSKYAGATLIEIGIYLEVKFLAQAFNSSALTYNPTLYSNEWPLMSAGGRKNVYAFNNPDSENITMTNIKEVALPSETFTMKYMDLKNGDISIVNEDDSAERNFIISFSNPIFSYIPGTNTVTVDAANVDELTEEADMTIVWKPAAMAFSSLPVQKSIHFSYTSPADYRYINFDSCGGSRITALVAKAGSSITWPAEVPVKRGYTFGGWYTDRSCVTEYPAVDTMPAFDNEDRGITVYAKWNPNPDSIYTVAHYQQSLKNPKNYTLVDSEIMIGETDSTTAAAAIDYYGFTAKPFTQGKIRPDESTVVQIYYDRDIYLLEFVITDPNESYVSPVLHDDVSWHHKFGEVIDVPAPRREGYTLTGWKQADDVPALITGETTATQNATYTAIWEPNINKVIFGDTGMYTMVQTGGKITTAPTELLKPGYIFAGWCRDASCIIPWDFDNDIVTGPMTLYDKWVPQYTCTVTFELNGGTNFITGGVEITWSSDDLKYYAQAVPEKQGCTFIGWCKDAECTIPWDFETDRVYENMTLYAKWSDNEYTVTFDTDGGTAISDVTAKWNTSITRPQNDPEKEHFTFVNWYKNSAFTILWDFDTDRVLEPTTIYAKWEKKSYTVTFDSNGGSEVNPITAEYDTTIPENHTETWMSHLYDFAGWFKDSTLESPWNFETDTVSGDITLYAKWEPHKFNVAFDTQGGSPAITAAQVPYGYLVEKPDNPTKAGNTFAGWYRDSGYSIFWYFAENTVSEDMTLFAKWNPIEYTVSFESNGGTAVNSIKADWGTTIQAPAEPYREGHDLAGWFKDEDCEEAWNFGNDTISGDTILYAKWSVSSYTVTFDSNDGSAVDSMTAEWNTTISEPDDPTREHYTFVGWCSDYELNNLWDFENDPVTSTTTLYAKWELSQYTVTFDSTGGSDVSSATAVWNTKVTKPENPTRADYTFIGWYQDENGTTPWNFNTDTITNTTTLYAKWASNAFTAEVSFETDGGSSVGPMTVVCDTYMEKPADPTRIGHIFVAWYADAELNTPWDFENDTVTGNMTLYAKWASKEDAIIVSFRTNGGSTVPDMEGVRDYVLTEPSAPVRENCTFAGWFKDEDCEDAWIFDTDTSEESLTLYAKWTADAGYCLVIFDTQGLAERPTPILLADGESIADPPDVERQYYEVSEWKIRRWDDYIEAYVYDQNWNFENTKGEWDWLSTARGEGEITLRATWVEAGLWVAGTEINTDANTSIDVSEILGGTNTGSVSFDAASNTLTLEDVSISVEMPNGIGVIQNSRNPEDVLTICLVGENSIINTYAGTGAEDDEIYGIKTNGGLRFTGEGTLTVRTEDNVGGDVGTNAAIFCKVNKEKPWTGVMNDFYDAPTLSMQGATVNAYAGRGEESYGVYLVETDRISGECRILYATGVLNAKGYTQALNAGGVYETTEGSEEATAKELLGAQNYGDEPNTTFTEGFEDYKSISVK